MTIRDLENEFEEDKYITLKGLINKNDGLFKSVNQRDYFKRVGVDYDTHSLEFLEVNLKADEFAVTAQGEYNFDPDRKGVFHNAIRPFSYQFICDSLGIFQLHKLTGKIERVGNDGGRVIWCNSELIWERPDDLDPELLKKDEPDSEWIGEVGDRFEKQVDIVFTTSYESRYGHGTMYKFQDQEDNIYIWFTTSIPDFSSKEGIKIKFKIKDHDTFKDAKQNIINYVKEVE